MMHPEELKENVQAIHDNLTGRIKELESALSHSRQEIEELKTENEKLREALKGTNFFPNESIFPK